MVMQINCTIKQNKFKHITCKERIEIYRLKEAGKSCREIWTMLKRHHTSISREINRNAIDYGWNVHKYKPLEADSKYITRRKKANLEHIILRKCWSMRMKIYSLLKDPKKKRWIDEIVWRLKLEWRACVSTSTVYRYIRKYTDRHKYLHYWKDWYKYKRRKRKKTQTIPNVPNISQRAQIINERWRVGDREIDTIVCSGHQGWIVTANDRKSLYVRMYPVQRLLSQGVDIVLRWILMHETVYSLTSDNWSEFAKLALTCLFLKCKWYTADPYCSWQRWTNEKSNWFIRRFIPKWTSISEITLEQIVKIENILNNKPRRKLGYRTPYEVYHWSNLIYIT